MSASRPTQLRPFTQGPVPRPQRKTHRPIDGRYENPGVVAAREKKTSTATAALIAAAAAKLGGGPAAEIKCVEGGPYLCTGALLTLKDGSTSFDATKTIALCACGRTATPPFCSGAHKNKPAEPAPAGG